MPFFSSAVIRYGTIILAGLAVGYGLMEHLQKRSLEQQAKQAFDRFKDICLAPLEQSRPTAFASQPLFGLPDLITTQDPDMWLDLSNNGILSISPYRCAYRFYENTAAQLISVSELLEQRTDRFVARYATELEIDPKAQLNPKDLFVAWTNWRNSPAGASRWGVTLLAGHYTAEGPFVSMTVTLPKRQP